MPKRDRPENDSHPLDLYRHMLRIRVFDQTVRELLLTEQIVRPVHPYVGQESIYVGASAALGDGDVVFPTYRGHSWAIACGVPSERLFAEFLGRARRSDVDDAYFSAPRYNFFGEARSVGSGAPIAAGTALAETLQRGRRVSIVACDHRAMTEAAVGEAISLAGSLRLPMVFVIENHWHGEIAQSRGVEPSDPESHCSSALGVPSVRVDGNDAFKVKASIRLAVERARTQHRPALVECTTQRLTDPGVPDAESSVADPHEPLSRMRRTVADLGVSDADIRRLHDSVRQEMETAARNALSHAAGRTETAPRQVFA